MGENMCFFFIYTHGDHCQEKSGTLLRPNPKGLGLQVWGVRLSVILFFRPQPQSSGPIELSVSVCMSVISFLYGLELLNLGQRDSVIGSKEILGPQMCLLTISVKNTRPKVGKLPLAKQRFLGPNPKVGGLQSWGVRPSVCPSVRLSVRLSSLSCTGQNF